MPILSFSITLIVVITCLSLANWQHNRAQDKQQRLDNINVIQSLGVMDFQTLNKLPKKLNKTGIKLQLTGKLDSTQYWLLDNRVFEKQVGFDVLVAFYPEQSKQVIIVNLGWVKAPASRKLLANVILPEQAITLQMQLKQGDLAGFYLHKQQVNNVSWPKRIQYIDLAIMQQESGQALQGFIGYSTTAAFSLQPHYQPVVMPPEKHLAYALQWLLLAIAALIVFLFAVKPFSQKSSFQGQTHE